MRISDRYIGKQVLLGTLYAVLVLGVVLVLGNLFKEIRPLLVEKGAPPSLVLRFVISVLPESLRYTIPWGFLSAVLLVFGRLSKDNEITAFRVAGISLVRLAVPVVIIGLGLSLISLWLNINVVPKSRASSKELLYKQAVRDPASLLKPGMIQGDFKGNGEGIQKLLIEGKSSRTVDGKSLQWLDGFHLYVLPKSATDDLTYVHATGAALKTDAVNGKLWLQLDDAYFETRDPAGKSQLFFAGASPLVFDINNPGKMRASAMSNEQIREEISSNPELTSKARLKMQSEIMKRYSFSMACLAFAFIAVPLGIQSSRRENSNGLILSLIIGTGYFMVTMLAEHVKSTSMATVVLWSPNVICAVLGLILFRRLRIR
jgi:lipopolysaccharide export LptBFGC system permease protein LptF